MEREDVERAALAPDRERDLDRDLPAAPAEPRREHGHQARVTRIQEPVELLAPPADPDIQICLQTSPRPSRALRATRREG